MTGDEELAREFETLRPQLMGAAYRVLGSLADAEDAVQETWLRWATADRAEVRDARAYLLTVATRQALNRVRQQQQRRESYVGPWLPEPVATERGPAEEVELADSVSMAMLVVLETLSPLERAAFVLHDVFGLSFAEVGASLGRTDAAARQLASRARNNVHARRPEVVDRHRHDATLQRFVEVLATGDVDGFMGLFAPDVLLVTDGGGVKKAALRPIRGADKVGRWLAAVSTGPNVSPDARIELSVVNDELAMIVYAGTELDGVIFLTVQEEGITAVHMVRNPAKLAALVGAGRTALG